MDKLLVVGAGPGQVPIIKAAKKLGLYVITVSIKGDYPGFKLADEVAYIDIFDVEKIVDYARNANVKGVISDQSDMAAPIVAQVADRLGLPNWGYDTALRFTDKVRMRQVFEELDLPVPAYRHTTSLEEAVQAIDDIGLPVVIKPTDAFASRGVFKVFTMNELRVFFPQSLASSRSGNVIVEKYISGEQYFCQGFVENHKLRLYAFSDRYYYNLENLAIPYTNAFPALISSDLENRMSETFTRVVDYLGPAFGHVWAEWIYDKENDVLYIIEMAIRGAGASVTDILLPAAYGIDSQPYLVRSAMGDKSKSFFDERIVQKSAAFFSMLLPQGRVVAVSGLDQLSNIRGVISVSFKDISVGDEIPAVENKNSRYGIVYIAAGSRNEVDNILTSVRNIVRIEIETELGIKGPIWE